MWKRTQVTELPWEARAGTSWLNPPSSPFPSLQNSAQWGHQSSPDEAVKPQSQQGDSDLIHQRPRDTKLLTPAQVSCTWGGPWGRERQSQHHTSAPLLWWKENPHSPLTFSTVTFYLGDKWPLGCAVLFTCQKHLSKQGNNSNVKPLEKCKAVTWVVIKTHVKYKCFSSGSVISEMPPGSRFGAPSVMG